MARELKSIDDMAEWLDRVREGECLDVLAGMPDASVHAVVTDPPYGMRFMGNAWDYDVPTVAVWAECLRVLKPGGHLLAFAGTRTQHRMAVNIEDAGFEIRDMIAWVYGCLSEDTEILLDGRWEPYHKAIDGGHALCYNAEHDEYKWERIQDFVVYDYDDTAFRIVSARTDQIVSRGHRCLVERGGKYAFQYAETLEREARVPVLEGVSGLLHDLPLPHKGGSGASSESRPAGQQPCQPGTVCEQQRPQAVRASRYTSADLARVEPVHYVGKVWCVCVPSGAFVARRNGKVFVTGNSGFPKSHNVSKAIDKAAGADEAQAWAGWGTALKPSNEPITVARKPLDGTVAANVLEHGCGGLNIDGCRVSIDADTDPKLGTYNKPGSGLAGCDRVYEGGYAGEYSGAECPHPDSPRHDVRGRWPANLIHDGSDEVLPILGDAARFFYCPKATKDERNAGCSAKKACATATEHAARPCDWDKAEWGAVNGNHHATVKPLALMRYLCRLVTPPNGIVLDPFAGSGSTLIAALQEGFHYVGIERNPEYTAIARARIKHARKPFALFAEALA